MPKPGEHKTVQARILKYASEIGWTVVSQQEAERRRGFNPDVGLKNRAKGASLFFDDLLDTKVRELNTQYRDDPGELQRRIAHFQNNIEGNRKFVEHLRNRGKYFDEVNNRERDLVLIDYEILSNNQFEVTEEFAYDNGRYHKREEVVFLINGIPVLVIECKNANKDEAVDRKYNPGILSSRQVATGL